MLKKTCPHCQNASFSATTLGGPWICPTCGEDITEVPLEPLAQPDPDNEADRGGNWLLQSFRVFLRRILYK